MTLTASIIIPVRNKIEFTAKCLSSIAAHPPQVSHEIIIVDNASDDGTQEFLEEKQIRGELSFIRNDPPNNFAVSCNQGAQLASGEYLVFLNNDTEAFPGWLDEMVDAAQRYSRVGAVGAKLLYPDETIQHAGVVFHYFKRLKICGPYHIFRKFPRNAPAVNQEREFQCVTGACLLTPKVVFDEMGGFDARFVNCFEDVDYCLRLGKAGYRVIYTPKAELIHYEGQTPGRNDSVQYSSVVFGERWRGKIRADELTYLEPEGFIVLEDEGNQLSVHPGPEMRQWWKMINQLVEMKQYRMAVEEMEKLEQIIGGNHREFYELKGRCHLSMGDFRAARMDYARAQTLEPDDPEPQWGLAQVALAEGKGREARRRLERLVAEHPGDRRRSRWQNLLEQIEKADLPMSAGILERGGETGFSGKEVESLQAAPLSLCAEEDRGLD